MRDPSNAELYRQVYDWVHSTGFSREMDKQELAALLEARSLTALTRILKYVFGPRVLHRRRNMTVFYRFPNQENAKALMQRGRPSCELRMLGGLQAPGVATPKRHDCITKAGDWSVLTY